MSDILIKNMRMPKGCCGKEYCQFVAQDYTGKFHCTLAEFKSVEPKCLKSKRPNGCPLVEVKPHGRLIDADKLTDTIISCIRDAEKEYPKKDFGIVKMVYESCLYHIGKAPTVLEASDGTDNQG